MTGPTHVMHADDIAGTAFGFRHPLDPSCGCIMAPMSRAAGMQNGAVNLVRIAPGEQGFPFHRHHGEDEWLFVLDGTGEVRIDDDRHAVSKGAFAHFPAGGPAHAVRNTGKVELVCLMGGTGKTADIIDVPELGYRVAATGGAFHAARTDAFQQIVPGGNTIADANAGGDA
ncbi:MAG: cupin domain-containing protein [Pseudomonadota bacterium]